MFCWRVDGLGKVGGSLTVFGLRCLLERRTGILRGRLWATDLYDLSWWDPFGLVVCVRNFLLERVGFVVDGSDCGVWWGGFFVVSGVARVTSSPLVFLGMGGVTRSFGILNLGMRAVIAHGVDLREEEMLERSSLLRGGGPF